MGCASCLKLMLPSGGENQRDDRPEAESSSSPKRSVAVVVIRMLKYETP